MSVFWASEARPVRRMTGAAGLLALFGLLACAPADARLIRTESDSTRPARRVIIDDDGIQIERSEPDVQIGIRDRRYGRGRVHVTVDGDTIDQGDHGFLVVDSDGDDVVRVFADAHVDEGERIEGDVVAVFGSVRVDGEVTGNVVAVFGSVELGPRSAVEGDVVAVGGGLDQAQGARVNGESVSLGFLPFMWGVPSLRSVLVAIGMGWLVSMIIGWLLVLLFPNRMRRVAATVRERGGASFFLGVASVPAVLLLCFLLVITFIGAPIALVVGLVFLVSAWAGHIAATWVLGARLLRRRPDDGAPLAAILAGTLFVAAFFVIGAILAGPPGATRTVALFFDLLGVLLVLGLTAIGTGAVFLSRFGTRPAVEQGPSVAPAPSGTAPIGPPPAAAPASQP